MYYGNRTLGSPDPKPEKVEKKKVGPYRYKRKPTGELEIFLSIWAERPHVCQVCTDPIPEPTPTNFAHVIPKAQNKYPKFKLNKQNILILCPCCHRLWDQGVRAGIRHDAKWYWVFELEASLKEQYKTLFDK